MFTKQDVLEAIGKDRVRQSTIETHLALAQKARLHPLEIGIGASDRRILKEYLVELETEGVIKSYGIEKKTYEVIPLHVPTLGADIKAVMDAAGEDLKKC